MKVLVARAYALFAYLAFSLTFTALVLASTGLVPSIVPAVDGAPRVGAGLALVIDVGLVLAFAVQHSVMARPGFKRLLPQRLERSTYVLASAVVTGAIAFGWAPIGGDVWRIGGGPALAVQALAMGGFGLTLVASFAFDHLALFGLTLGKPPAFATPPLYRVVRHPMMLGVMIGVWAAPHMTLGHVVFAVTMTGYIIVGIRFEERSLLRELGDRYARYCQEVPMLLPWPRPRAHQRPGVPAK
jgi:protein-S-isoprenylcysteine O-methyltransferase Ste14